MFQILGLQNNIFKTTIIGTYQEKKMLTQVYNIWRHEKQEFQCNLAEMNSYHKTTTTTKV